MADNNYTTVDMIAEDGYSVPAGLAMAPMRRSIENYDSWTLQWGLVLGSGIYDDVELEDKVYRVYETRELPAYDVRLPLVVQSTGIESNPIKWTAREGFFENYSLPGSWSVFKLIVIYTAAEFNAKKQSFTTLYKKVDNNYVAVTTFDDEIHEYFYEHTYSSLAAMEGGMTSGNQNVFPFSRDDIGKG